MSLPQQRSFNCLACKGIIYIPYNLPATVAPCPHCGVSVTSPPPPSPDEAIPATQPPSSVEVVSKPASVVLPQARSRTAVSDTSSETSEPAEANRQRATNSAVPWLVAIVLLAIGVGGGWMLWREYRFQQLLASSHSSAPAAPIDPELARKQYYLKGWQVDAEATLTAFIKAKTPEEKARNVIGGMETYERLRKHYGEKIMQESLTSAETFYGVSVKGESEKTNIFLMTHHRPQQFCMSKFFRPLISSEKLHGIEELDELTESLSNIEHFTMPRHTIQAYFKKTDQGMLVDWDIYCQTRFQSLKHFMEQQTAGVSEEFRVLIYQEAISSENRNNKDHFYYRVCDPAHIEDNFLIEQRRDSPIIAELSKLHVVGSVSQATKVETATVLLEHDGNGGTHIKKFICWEFAGLGGVAGKINAQGSGDDGEKER
jgi:ABC-type nickel/cobalt efflux system permease component RcnA